MWQQSWLGTCFDKNRLVDVFPRITPKYRKPSTKPEEFRALVPRIRTSELTPGSEQIRLAGAAHGPRAPGHPGRRLVVAHGPVSDGLGAGRGGGTYNSDGIVRRVRSAAREP